MNREIKFRIWNLEYKRFEKYIIEDSLRLDCSPSFAISVNGELIQLWHYEWDIYDEENKKCVLMQYTGLKDKNGKEIYEGDVVIGMMKDQITRTKITFIKGEIVYKNLIGAYTLNDRHLHWFDSFEVIGNIYENPGLLDKE